MKYAIEKNGVLISSVSAWTPGLAKKCGLVGNNQVPQRLPFDLNDGAKLRAVLTVKASPNPYQFVIDDGGAVVGDEWVITQSLQDKAVEQIASQKRVEINNETARRIDEVVPLRKLERAIELIEIRNFRDLSNAEDNEVTVLKGIKHQIKAIRQQSNLLKSLLDKELANIDVFDDANWGKA
ncbi:hypothetical protein [Kiloniella litopenaei]|uniref:hypothetical protein n=1 Tax=Kiloniella litopenaei TaxID=1549748 RepID=UPI003BA9E3EE